MIDGYRMSREKEEMLSHMDEIHQLMEGEYWAKNRDVDRVEKIIRNSDCYAIFDTAQNRIVGFARVVTDHATMYYLTDVIVDPEHRGRGLGKLLVEQVTSDGSLENCYGLLYTKDAQGLYSQYGFEEPPETGMFHKGK